MRAIHERKFKVVLLGDGGVGKTSLVKRFVYSNYDEKYLKTLGVNVYKKEFDQILDHRKIKINLQVWDVMGQKYFPNVIKESVRDAGGVLLVCDLTNLESLTNLYNWVQLVYESTEKVTFGILANKSDLNDLAFGIHAVRDLADKFDAPYYITSAKTGDNVEKAFHSIGVNIYDGKFIKPVDLPKADEEPLEIPKIIVAEDNIINAFCNQMGGYERAMPIVRKQFQQLNIDFEKPTKVQLERLVAKLTELVSSMKSPEDSRKIGVQMKAHLHGL